MPGCSAPFCTNRAENGFRMFRFPSDHNRRAIWIKNVHREKWCPPNTARLCSVHFDASQFENKREDGIIKLKPNAVPTIFDKMISKSKVYCSVPQCNIHIGKSISMHRFPTDPVLLRKWKMALKINRPISKYMVVCSEHFLPTDYCLRSSPSPVKPRLKRGVVPSQKIPNISPNHFSLTKTPPWNKSTFEEVDPLSDISGVPEKVIVPFSTSNKSKPSTFQASAQRTIIEATKVRSNCIFLREELAESANDSYAVEFWKNKAVRLRIKLEQKNQELRNAVDELNYLKEQIAKRDNCQIKIEPCDVEENYFKS